VIRRLLTFFALASCATAAPTEVSSVSAEHAQVSIATGETILTGHPKLVYGDLLLTADEFRENSKTHLVIAKGHAVLTKGPRRLLADTITYNRVNETFKVGELRTGEFPVYITGSSATGDRDTIVVNDAHVTIPEPGLLIATIHAARLFFTADHRIRAENASVGLGDFRPLPVRGFEHDVRSPFISNVSVTGGYRRSLGVYTILSLHLPVTADFNLGADLGLYSARGIMVGPSGSYDGGNDDSNFTGFFRSGFINDYGDRLTDIIGRPVPPHRGFIEWQHRQDIGEHLELTGQLNYWRDSEVVRDFRPGDFFNVQQPDTFLESVYSGDNYFVSLFARFQPNSFQTVQQRLPELRFDLLPLALGGGIYERFNASIAVLREDPLPVGPLNPVAGPELRSDRFDAYYSLSRPIRPTEWSAFTPVVGGRLTHYADLSGTRSDYTRALGEIGFDAEVRASGVYDYKNPRWKIDGLRHLLTPRISYRYIPDAEKGAAYIPPIDRESFSTYLQPLGLGDIRNIDDLHGENTLRIGLDNTLQTRDPVYGSRDLVTLNIANDFRFKRAPGERDVSEIHSELAVMPARWLELGVYQSFAPQTFTLREFNTGITLRDGDEWTLRFASNFLRHELDDYLFQGSRRLNEVYEAIARVRYNARQQRFDEQSYGVRQNLGNIWSIDYLVTLYDGPRRESRFGFNVRVQAIRF